jgi:hypothetical protein
MRIVSGLALFAIITCIVGFAPAKESDRAAPAPKAVPSAGSPAAQAFEKFKLLAGGAWEARKADDQVCRAIYQIIANGSCVMETFEFVGQPEHTMVTMYHMNGPDLLLTHYCMAGNQPRMQATELAADGSTALFTYKDGTNMASRDEGHMDKASFKFVDADTFTSQWTWYEDGKESWMEEFTYVRKP